MAGLYIHIPFCKRRCHYCDFYSTTQEQLQDAYVAAVCQEMEERERELHEPIKTLYIGGGTPSQLSPLLLTEIVRHASDVFGFKTLKEFTIEANPDDITPAWVMGIRQAVPEGRVRVSMGIQTFDDATLALIGRRHNAAQALAAVRTLRDAGIDEISIDLMYGLPGEDESRWASDLEQATALGVPHISAYCLTYEEGTVLWKQREDGKVEEADEELCERFYFMLRDRLKKAGYEHYELSNFAFPGHHALHNASYWNGTPYLGIGPGAHSYDGSTRSWNAPDLKAYIANPLSGRSSEVLTDDEKYDEYVMTRLRTAIGIDPNELERLFGTARRDYCLAHAHSYLKSHRLRYTADGHIVLGEEGLFVSDGIIANLFS